MTHNSTVFAQLLKLVPRHEFEAAAKAHHHGHKLRKMSRWAQLVALGLGQLAGRSSLRDIVSNLQVQGHKLYHLGIRPLNRSSLARVNEQQPYSLYEALFARLLGRCQRAAPGHGFRFKNKLYSLDASTIDLCLSMFPWAKFRRTKGAVKLHVGVDHEGYLPTFLRITEGKTHDITAARALTLPKESIVAADRGYVDYGWFNQLNTMGIYFVTRTKRNTRYSVRQRRPIGRGNGITSDQTIVLTSQRGKAYPQPLRRVGYKDPDTGKHYFFLTNNFKLAAKTIADIYKARWQIELFFKWIKQNLRVKSFVGTSRNAVLTQIWVAMCMYLLLSYIKFTNRLGWSLQQLLRVLQLNLFERRSLLELFTGDPTPPDPPSPQLPLAWT